MTVTVAHPAVVKRLHSGYRYWVYADDDQDIYWRLTSAADPASRPLLTPAEFETQVMALRAAFVNWVDQCLERAPYEAWFTTPLYKNPLDNRLFLHYCWLTAIDMRLASGERDILVISESSGLARALEAVCAKYGVRCGVIGLPQMRLARMRRLAHATGAFVSNVCGICWRMLLTRIILGRRHRRKLQNIELLVDTYVLTEDIDSNGDFRDRYFPGLIDWYERQGLACGVYPFMYDVSPLHAAMVYSRFRQSRVLFLPYELFASALDVWWAIRVVWMSLNSPPRVATANAREVDLAPLVAWQQTVSALRAVTALVMFRVPARLAAAGIRPRWLIDWYENQPNDKATTAGFRAAGKACHVIAVRQYPPMHNFLSLYTTGGEARAGVSPVENWVCGRAHVDAMAIYDPVGTYKVVPGLRYSHVHRDAGPAQAGDSLLVLMPYATADAQQVLHCVVPVLAELAARCKRVIMKPHHTMARSVLARYMEKRWPHAAAGIEWSDDALMTLLPTSRIVVSTQSSAMLEAVCVGVPVAVVGRTAGITVNPVEDVDRRLWRLVYDSGELAQAIREWSPRHPLSAQERRALGDSIRAAHFEPTNETTMRAFLPEAAASRALM